MAKTWHQSIHLHIARSHVNNQLIHWSLTRAWYDGNAVPREGRKYRRVVLDEGVIVHPEEIRDIAVLVTEISSTIELRAHGVAPARQAGPRERSGIENIPALPESRTPGQTEHSPATPGDPDPA